MSSPRSLQTSHLTDEDHQVTERAAVAKDEVDGEDGGVPELNDWV